MTSPRLARALRGTAAAGVATFTSSFGHAVGQQSLPSGWIVALAVVLAVPVCVLLAGRRLSVVRLAASVGLSQLAFHLLLRLDFAGSAAVTGMAHHGGADVLEPAAAAAASHDLTPAMWAGHVVAALATVVALAFGERATVALADLARRPFRALAPLPPRPVAAPAAIAAATRIRSSVVRVVGVRRRGPPLAA